MKHILLFIIGLLFIVGCGAGGSSSSSSSSVTKMGIFLDSPVEGLEYSSPSYSGTTDSNGYFYYKTGEEVTFKLGAIILGKSIPNQADSLVTPLELASTTDTNDTRVVEMLRVLQTLDDDNNSANGIRILESKRNNIKTVIDLSQNHTALTDTELANLLDTNATNLKSSHDAITHFQSQLTQKEQYQNQINKENEQNHDNVGQNGTNNNNNSSNTTSSGYTLLAWNDLGMHCFDGSDFSVFSILPPYNNLIAQLIVKDGTSNKHVTSGVNITYESYNYLGHINTQSSTKTNFWDYLTSLFPSATSKVDIGLTGNKTPSSVALNMTLNSTNNWFEATGIPMINRDDNNDTNYYPMVKVTAKDSTTGTILATANVVLPVSDEMNCKKCHASNSTLNDAKPTAGWVNNSDALKDYKLNILRLHDQKHPNAVSDNISALQTLGYDYNLTGLEATANNGTPILCAICHKSNALSTSGIGDIKPLTQALHAKHSTVTDPDNNLTLNSSSNRNACYSCHPGSATQCLRGAMGSAKDSSGNNLMQCQSCHGSMSDVGSSLRQGWLDEPNCQVCHQNAQRYTSALVNGSLRAIVDKKFATNDNTPMDGISLYRYSKGHGNLQCASCHGSTHAIYPSNHAADNILSQDIQGHSGTIAECTACHTTMPITTTGGPHGMHTVGQDWIRSHRSAAKHNGRASCAVCHGSDYKGSVLSKTFSARSFSVEHGTKTYVKGQQVTCYDCHNGPSGDD